MSEFLHDNIGSSIRRRRFKESDYDDIVEDINAQSQKSRDLLAALRSDKSSNYRRNGSMLDSPPVKNPFVSNYSQIPRTTVTEADSNTSRTRSLRSSSASNISRKDFKFSPSAPSSSSSLSNEELYQNHNFNGFNRYTANDSLSSPAKQRSPSKGKIVSPLSTLDAEELNIVPNPPSVSVTVNHEASKPNSALLEELDSLKEELTLSRSECQKLNHDLLMQIDRANLASEEKARLDNQIASMNIELNSTQNQLHCLRIQLQNKIASHEEYIEEETKQRNDLESRIVNLERELEAQRSSYQKKSDDYRELERAYDNLQLRMGEQASLVSSIDRTLADNQLLINRLTHEKQDLQGKLEVAEKLVLQYDSSSAKLVDTTNRLEAANAKFKEEDEKKVEVFMKCTDRFEKYRALCHSLLRFNALNQTKFKKYRYFNALRHYSLSRSNSSSSGTVPEVSKAPTAFFRVINNSLYAASSPCHTSSYFSTLSNLLMIAFLQIVLWSLLLLLYFFFISDDVYHKLKVPLLPSSFPSASSTSPLIS